MHFQRLEKLCVTSVFPDKDVISFQLQLLKKLQESEFTYWSCLFPSCDLLRHQNTGRSQ